MKKVALILALLLMLCTMLLTSCLVGPPNTDDPQDGETEGVTPMKLIVPKDSKYYLDYEALKNAYLLSCQLYFYEYTDAAEAEGEGELVIGDSNRSITATAKSLLAAEVKKADNDDEIGYIIYCDGKSVAFCWDDRFSKEVGYAYLLENFAEAGVDTFEEGIVAVETMDKSDAKKAEEAIEEAEDFAYVTEQLGEEAAEALRAHIDLYDERFYLWIANLYDPGVGGFYYSNEALKNQGFLPDLESTRQALAFFNKSGMIAKYKDGFEEAVPELMQKQIVGFARGTQSSEDGYFYHPQWGTDIQPSRLSRDLTSATTILEYFGAKPKWNAPNGTQGEFGKAPGATAFTAPLGRSTVAAVSAVIPTASMSVSQFPKRLQTLEDWREYILVTLNGNLSADDETPNKIRTDSYKIGNDVGSHAAQLKQRDALGLELGEFRDENGDGRADGGFVETVERLFNSWLLDYNGLWEHNKSIDPSTGKPDDDPDGETYYNAINGLMKIGSMYSSLDLKHPCAEKAVESAIYMVNYMNKQSDGKPGPDVMGKRPEATVDVYNPWVSISEMLSNIKENGSAAELDLIQNAIRQNAAEMIKNTTAKVVHFRKEDGSFGYRWGTAGTTSQGAHVTTGLKNEGDVNGGCISVTGVTGDMYTALGLRRIPIFRDSDWDVCLEIFENATPVLKDEIILDDVSAKDFDDYDVGTRGEEIDCIKSQDMNAGQVEIVASPPSDLGYGGGNALKFVSKSGAGDKVTFGVGGSGKSCFVLEFDIYVESTENKTQTLYQINLGKAFRLLVRAEKDSDTVYLADSNVNTDSEISNNLGIYFNKNEWHRVRVEYYPSSADQVRTKIFFDEELRAVSTNYYGRDDRLEVPSAPVTTYTEANFYGTASSVHTTYLDNILVAKYDMLYVEQEIKNPYLVKDFETPASDFETSYGSTRVVDDLPDGRDGHALYFDSMTTATFLGSVIGAEPNCYAAELTIYADEMQNGGYVTVYLGTTNTAEAAVAWRIVNEYGELCIYEVSMVDKAEKQGELVADGISSDEWVKLRFEYYRYQFDQAYSYCKSIIYIVDGDELDEIGRGNAYYQINNMKGEYTHIAVVSSGGGAYIDDIKPTAESKPYVDEDGDEVEDTEYPFPTGGASVDNLDKSGSDGFYDFEDSSLGLPTSPGFKSEVNAGSYGTSMEVVADPTDEGRGKVLEVYAVKGSKGNSSVYGVSNTAGGNCTVLEFKIYVDYSIGDKSMQCFFRDANNKNIAACSIVIGKTDDGYDVQLYEKHNDGSKSLGTFTADGGWMTLRVEYYADAHRTLFYINGENVASSSRYYTDYTGSGTIATARIFSLSGADSHYYLDDVIAQTVVQSSEGK